jgi:1,4-dihydroxy-2-naphthoyl-CoA hydrolase
MIWPKKPTTEILQRSCAGTMCDHLGIVFTEVGDDYLEARMPVDARTKQPAGLLHGGASLALAETLGSVASAALVDPASKMPVGIEINANHLKSATSGTVTGRVTPLRIGRTVHVWNIAIRNENAEPVCVSRLTVMIIDKKRPA